MKSTVWLGFLHLKMELNKSWKLYLYWKSISAAKYLQFKENFDHGCFPSSWGRTNLNHLKEISLEYNLTLTWWLECSPMAPETWVQSQDESYQRLKKWYLMPPCLTLSIIMYGSRVNWSIPGKEYRPPLHLGIVVIEKGAFGSPSTMVVNVTYYIYVYV